MVTYRLIAEMVVDRVVQRTHGQPDKALLSEVMELVGANQVKHGGTET